MEIPEGGGLTFPCENGKSEGVGGPIWNSLRGRGLDIFWNYTFQTKLNFKQNYFSYSLDKAFHSPEFQAKLFFTQNWVGSFYWDSLLILIYICISYTIFTPLINNWLQLTT